MIIKLHYTSTRPQWGSLHTEPHAHHLCENKKQGHNTQNPTSSAFMWASPLLTALIKEKDDECLNKIAEYFDSLANDHWAVLFPKARRLVTIHMDSFSFLLTPTPLWLISLMIMTHCSHTYSTLTHFSHDYDSLFPHLLHSDSFLSWLWLIIPTPAPLWLINPYCTFTIYMARYPLVTLAWSYSNIPEF